MYTDVVWKRREPLHGRGVGGGCEGAAVRGVVGYQHPHGRGVARLNVPASLYEKGIESKLSGNEVHYTNASILVVKNMLLSKLHCQNF